MKITYDQIMALEPCYDLADIGMPKDYEDTLEHFIKDYRSKVKNGSDIVWVAMRVKFCNEQDLRLFAVWCARQVQHLLKDELSIHALDVGERFAFGLATQQELDDARAAYAAAFADAYAADADAYAAFAAFTAASADAAYAADVNAQIDTILEMIKAPNGAWFNA